MKKTLEWVDAASTITKTCENPFLNCGNGFVEIFEKNGKRIDCRLSEVFAYLNGYSPSVLCFLKVCNLELNRERTLKVAENI